MSAESTNCTPPLVAGVLPGQSPEVLQAAGALERTAGLLADL